MKIELTIIGEYLTMSKMGTIEKELASYLVHSLKWGEDAIAIGMCCNDNELAAQMLDFLKNNNDIAFDVALGKAVEFREKKYGKQKFVVVDD